MSRIHCRVRWLIVLILWCLGFCCPCVLADDDIGAQWTHLSMSDGLNASTAHSLLALPDGRVLIGTSRGVTLWDGASPKPYGRGLETRRVTALAQAKGVLWAGTWGNGLHRYADGVWVPVRAEDTDSPGLWISGLAGDDQQLWVAGYGDGLAEYDGQTWEAHHRMEGGLPSDWLTTLQPDGQGGLWIGTERVGLAHLDAHGQWSYQPLPQSAGTEVTAIAQDDGRLLVGTMRGLWTLADERWRPLFPGAVDGPRQINDLLVQDKGQLWIAADAGLYISHDGRSLERVYSNQAPIGATSSLSQDAQGRIWAGTLGQGLWVQGDLSMAEPERFPVLLVHGWRGPDSDLLEDSEFWHLASWLRDDGFEPYYVSGISPEQTLYTNALRLKHAVAQAKAETGSDQVYIIAFSMGGLNTRAYLESTLYDGDVVRAFILGTPHYGEHLWRDMLLWEGIHWSDEPSTFELLPIHQSLFADTHRPASVPYTLIAGDVTRDSQGVQASDPWDVGMPLLFEQLPASDGLVSTWSALGVNGAQVTQFVTDDLHAAAKETILLDLPALLMPRQTYDACIRPCLFGAEPIDDTLLADEYSENIHLEPRSGFRSAELAPGEVVALDPIPVEQAQHVRFYARWKGPSLTMRLIDPSGEVVDEDVAEDDDALTYLGLDWADFASYVISDAVPGPWTIQLEAGAENADISQVVAYATFDSDLRLEASVDSAWYVPGQNLAITATVTGLGSDGQVDRAQGLVYAPKVSDPESVVLNASSSTGFLTGQSLPIAEGGYGAILTRVEGVLAGKPFERGAATTFGVSTEMGRLGGPPELARSGDRLLVTQSVIIERPGLFALAIELVNDAGETLAFVNHPLSLGVGCHRVVVPAEEWVLPPGIKLSDARPGSVTLLDIGGATLLLDRVSADVGAGS